LGHIFEKYSNIKYFFTFPTNAHNIYTLLFQPMHTIFTLYYSNQCTQYLHFTIPTNAQNIYTFSIPTNAHNIYTLKSTKIHIKTLNTCLYVFRSLFKTILRGLVDSTLPSY